MERADYHHRRVRGLLLSTIRWLGCRGGLQVRHTGPSPSPGTVSCGPSSIIRGWSEPNSVSKIEIDDSTAVIRHEYMDTVRHVDLTTREHPASITPSLTGHSVGWFEDDTLVIETVGFEAGVLLPHPGLLHSENMQIVERLGLGDDGSTLIREYVVSDPDYLKTPFTGQSSWTRSNIQLREYNCTELGGLNNTRQ